MPDCFDFGGRSFTLQEIADIINNACEAYNNGIIAYSTLDGCVRIATTGNNSNIWIGPEEEDWEYEELT